MAKGLNRGLYTNDLKYSFSNQLIYDYPTPTGQTTSYRTGDDGYQFSNLWQPFFAIERKGRKIQLATWLTLTSPNMFGNTNRFTDQFGGQTYADNYAIDHYTGLGWITVPNVIGQNWNTAIDGAEAETYLNFTDWQLPNVNQIMSILNYSVALPLNYAPFNLTAAASIKFLWTSTTVTNSTTFAYIVIYNHTTANLPGVLSSVAKTTTTNCHFTFCRKHF